MNDLEIPFREADERELIGCILADARRFDELRNYMDADDFFDERWQLMWQAIENCTTSGDVQPEADPDDPLQLHPHHPYAIVREYRELAKDSPGLEITIDELYEMRNRIGSDFRWYAKQVHEAAMVRRLHQTMDQAGEFITHGKSAETAFNEIQAEFFRQAPKSTATAIELSDVDAYRRMVRSETVDKIPTGFSAIDEKLLDGGMARGRIFVIAGRPGTGKTSFTLNLAMNVAFRSDADCLVVSLEQRTRDVIEQVASAETRTPQIGVDQVEDFLIYHEHEGRRVAIIQQSGLTAEKIVGAARERQRRHGLDVLLVDYLQLVTGTKQSDSRAYQIEHICKLLQDVAKELNIAVVLCAQLSREAERADQPSMAHLKDSGAIEQAADFIGLLWRDSDTSPVVHMKVPKNRYGRARIEIDFHFHGEYKRFDSAAESRHEEFDEFNRGF